MDTPFLRAVTARDPLIGRLLHDRYKVHKRIGKGGMGIVYLAEHVLLRRKVALKILGDRAFASDEMVARFHREATAAAAVGSEHIVDVTDMGMLEDGSFFIVLEYLEGAELALAIANDGPMPLGRAVHVISQLCDALTAVHSAGIVHRDLKPENLFLVSHEGETDFLKVLDFGVCKVFEDRTSGDRPLTRTGTSLGTPEFMAPEQIDGSEDADARADIYAAGAILYFALTGAAPFESASLPRLFMRVSSEPPPSLLALRPDLPPALDAVIKRALQKRPEDRYQSSAELRAALQPFAALPETAPVRARSHRVRVTHDSIPLPPKRTWLPRAPRARVAAIALGCVLLVALSVALSAAWHGHAAAPVRLRSPAQAANAAVKPSAPAADPSHDQAAAPNTAANVLAAPPAEPAQRDAARATHHSRLRKPSEPEQPSAAIAAEPAPEIAPAPAPVPSAAPEAVNSHPEKPKADYGIPQRELKPVFR